jgi:IMP dehydrogenase
VTQEIEIGRSKRGRRVYAFDDIAIVPSRRTRDPEDVSVGWTIDAYQFDIPFLAAPMDSVVSPRTAIMMGQLGGLGVLDLEGLWTRYEDPEPVLAEIRNLADDRATASPRSAPRASLSQVPCRPSARRSCTRPSSPRGSTCS